MLLIGIPLVAVCFWRDTAAGFAATALFVLLLCAFAWYTRNRYRQIAGLSEQLARIAGGDYQVNITAYSEGELSILASEILKITTALSHQTADLQRDKAFLADTLADISHQLKTPLTSLSMMTDLLETPDLPEKKRVEFLRGVRASLDRIQWLVSSLLKLSRLDAGAVMFQREWVSPTNLLAGAIAPLRLAAEEKRQKLSVITEEDILLNTDVRWLAESVGNVVKNCMEHTGRNGQIEISCRQNPLYTVIQVCDNGPGIAAKDLPHLFERFYRGENASPESVGIGLALSRSIVQNLGGTLTAENRPSGGAQFTIKLYRQAGK